MNEFLINMTITYDDDARKVRLKINQAEFTVDIYQFIREYGLVETDVTLIIAHQHMKSCDEEEKRNVKNELIEIGISDILIF